MLEDNKLEMRDPAISVDSDELEDKPGRSRRKLLMDFCDYTSTHGPAHVKRVRSKCAKLAWLAVIVVFWGIMAWQLIILLINYLSFDFNILLEVQMKRSLNFPAVTLCNMNPFRNSRIRELMTTMPELEEAYNKLINAERANSSARSKRSLRRYRRQTDEDDDYFFEDYDDDFTAEVEFVRLVNTAPVDTLGHQLDTMLLDCQIDGRTCTPQNFTRSWNYLHGNCYTFTAENVRISNPGQLTGLELRLFVELNEYLVGMGEESGFKIIVHDKHTIPFPDQDGLSVSTGYSTAIGLRMTSVERLSSPYFKCFPRNTAGKRNIYSHQQSRSYSRHVCDLSCYQHAVVETCGCADPELPYDHPLFPANTSSCSQTAEFECQASTMNDYVDDYVDCPTCHQVCNENKYKTTASMSNWPAPKEDSMKFFVDGIGDEQPAVNNWLATHETMTASQVQEDIRSNVAKVVLYFEDISVERVYQTPAYTWVSFISNVGGLFGLWVGMSVLSICEWLELLGRVVTSCCRGNRTQVDTRA